MMSNRRNGIRWVGVTLLACSSVLLACGPSSKSKPATALAVDPSETKAQEALERARAARTWQALMKVAQDHAGTEAGDTAQLEGAQKAAEQSRVALGKDDYSEARKLAQLAMAKGDPLTAQAARDTLQQAEKAEARELTVQVTELLKKDPTVVGCSGAVTAIHEALGEQPSDSLVQAVRASTHTSIEQCVATSVESASTTGAFAPALQLVQLPALVTAVGSAKRDAMLDALQKRVVAAMLAEAAPEIKAGKWELAVDRFGAWKKDGRADTIAVEAAGRSVRDDVSLALMRRAEASLGTRNAESVAKDIERASQVFSAMGLDPNLVAWGKLLGWWQECEKQACRPSSGKKMYLLGSAMPLVEPSTKKEGAAKWVNGTALWELAAGKGLSLVTSKEPKPLTDWKSRLLQGQGWVPTAALQTQDTATWLPKGPALVGEQVWLPTGGEDKLYQLGVVESVKDAQITVKKLSDDMSVTVGREVLRSGALLDGLKVLAFCRDTRDVSAARIQRAGELKGSRVRVMCVKDDGADDESRFENLGALRARLADLPPLRP